MRSSRRVANDNTYIEQTTAALNDTHVYPSAGVPNGAVIDKGTLKFRWSAQGIISALYGLYRRDLHVVERG